MTKWDKSREVYGNLDPRIRLGIQILALGVGVYVVYRVITGANQLKEDKDNRGETQSIANELQKLNQNPSTKQTISTSQAKSYANKIYASMQGVGTYEEEIMGVFYKLKNDADFLAVSKAFDTRDIPSGSWFVSDFRGTLIQCLASEVSSYWTRRINTILSNKRISYRV